jgi:NRAMP (natural resistance-associated macrophage protein)-like metal ion transporter
MDDRLGSTTVGRPAERRLGPGLLTGACNDDPSSVGTYSQLGAQFGYALAWTLLFSYPLVVAVQEISARIGRVTGRGLAGNLQRRYPRWLAWSLVTLLFGANVFNLAADLGAMGAVLKLLFDAPALLYVCLLALGSLAFQMFTHYARYVSMLKWLCLSLLSYVACAFVVGVPWHEVVQALLWPPLSLHPQYLMGVVAALGTTITPYLFFWQAQLEVEEGRQRTGAVPLVHAVGEAPREFARIRLDTLTGMGLSSTVALFIIITTASTLHARGLTTIESAADAAEALRAVAGRFTFVVFALGIIGAGLLTLPALSASAAYAAGELMPGRIRRGAEPGGARAFQSVIAAATVIACALNFTPINPMRALYWSAVLNGVIAIPLLVAMMHLATSQAIMGSLRLPRGLCLLGWAATLTMTVSVAGMALAWLIGG